MRTSSYKILAGERVEIAASGNYVLVRESDNTLIIEHPEKSEIIEASQGDDFEFSDFKSLYVTNTGATDEIVKLTISNDKKAGSAKVGGSVAVAGAVALDTPTITALTVNRGGFTQGRASVTNVNQVLIAADAARRYLLIQNNDVGAVLRVTLNGVAATVAQGFRIPAGGVLEIPAFSVTGAINCIMETATAAAGNVEFVTG